MEKICIIIIIIIIIIMIKGRNYVVPDIRHKMQGYRFMTYQGFKDLWSNDLHAITIHGFLLLQSLYISETEQSLHRRPECVKVRRPFWAPVPNKPTVSVDVKHPSTVAMDSESRRDQEQGGGAGLS